MLGRVARAWSSREVRRYCLAWMSWCDVASPGASAARPRCPGRPTGEKGEVGRARCRRPGAGTASTSRLRFAGVGRTVHPDDRAGEAVPAAVQPRALAQRPLRYGDLVHDVLRALRRRVLRRPSSVVPALRAAPGRARPRPASRLPGHPRRGRAHVVERVGRGRHRGESRCLEWRHDCAGRRPGGPQRCHGVGRPSRRTPRASGPGRPGAVGAPAGGRPPGPGGRGRRPATVIAGPTPGGLPERAALADRGAVGRDRRPGRGHGPVARRRPDHRVRLAGRLLRQPPDRAGRLARRPQRAAHTSG